MPLPNAPPPAFFFRFAMAPSQNVRVAESMPDSPGKRDRTATEAIQVSSYPSDKRIAETHAREPAEIQVRRVNFGIKTEGDGGDLRVRGQVSSGSCGFQ